MEMKIQHFSHKHSLILNEIYDAEEDDVCYGCNEQIFSCKLFVYSCINSTSTIASKVDNECLKFLLHRSCAELPLKIPHPKNPKRFLFLDDMHKYSSSYSRGFTCVICNMEWKWFSYYNRDNIFDYFVCIKCAMFQLQSLEDRKFDHPAHRQHPLTLVQHLASFRCHACHVDDDVRDLSYICTKCPFWMHKNCADAPPSFRFQFHTQHPLILSFSLPQVYQKFNQYCTICNEKLNRLHWLYYCPSCRFFAHFHCARSNPMLSSGEDEMYDPNLVHLPAADESAVNLLYEQFVKALSTPDHTDDTSIYSATKGIKHWSHDEHELQLLTIDELNDWKDDDVPLLLCDGCVKPIRTDGGVFYGCDTCKYFLHRGCAELPRDIKHQLWPGSTISAHKYKEPYQYFGCEACDSICNGIYFDGLQCDIGCISLPKTIKHEAHHHQLNQIKEGRHSCKACDMSYNGWQRYKCKTCDLYTICATCIMRPRTLKHPWDPHALHLIYDPAMVSDHEHEYDCEFCSEVIDTNFWFYHCSDCDLSFHLWHCLEESSHYLGRSKMKFGATDIIKDKLHPHSLTFVLLKGKRRRYCEICGYQQSVFALECAPCKATFCTDCCLK